VRRAVLSWAAVVVWAGIIFWASAHTGSDLDSGPGLLAVAKRALKAALAGALGPDADVSPIGHFAEYLVFGALLLNALRRHLAPRHAALLAVLLASAYGVSDEVHQLFVPGRMCDAADWLVDTAGATLGVALLALAPRAREKSGRA